MTLSKKKATLIRLISTGETRLIYAEIATFASLRSAIQNNLIILSEMGDEKQLEININQGETQEYFADIAGFASLRSAIHKKSMNLS